jgi:hypothetical protein
MVGPARSGSGLAEPVVLDQHLPPPLLNLLDHLPHHLGPLSSLHANERPTRKHEQEEIVYLLLVPSEVEPLLQVVPRLAQPLLHLCTEKIDIYLFLYFIKYLYLNLSCEVYASFTDLHIVCHLA